MAYFFSAFDEERSIIARTSSQDLQATTASEIIFMVVPIRTHRHVFTGYRGNGSGLAPGFQFMGQ